jgi:hypothetical protein
MKKTKRKKKNYSSHRVIDTFALLSVIIIAGLYTKLYDGLFHHWVSDSLSGVIYVLFWCLVISLPGVWKKGNISIAVFLLTCILEFLQLWHPPFLNAIRSHQFGAYLLGTVFHWTDFPYYAVGCGLGYLLMKSLDKKVYVKK